MIHKPIELKNLELSFPHKTCFEDFSAQIHYGSRIAIIGRNGSGKSTLLKMLQGGFAITGGDIKIPNDVVFGYVPQVIAEGGTLSGGQRLNKAITSALGLGPNVLLLDEPTNHLDSGNRKSLLRMLKAYPGTLIVVSHDTELLRNCIDTLWHIDNGKIHTFSGNYDDYMREMHLKRASIERELSRLERAEKSTHNSLMKEQERAAKSRAKGEKSIAQRKWPSVLSRAKALRAEETSGRKKADIDHKKQELSEQLTNLRLPEIILPRFSICPADTGNQVVVQVSDGSVGYMPEHPILKNINLSLGSKDRMAIVGDNGSGKSTLVKAILGDGIVLKSGQWYAPQKQDIGYLDQNYNTLHGNLRVIDVMQSLMPHWSHAETRRHLNDFLFRKNEEVNAKVEQLSGGEMARLSLAQIAAKPPKLVILDEITNNLDLETRGHVLNVLKAYRGAIIIISHDEDFLNEIGVEQYYEVKA